MENAATTLRELLSQNAAVHRHEAQLPTVQRIWAGLVAIMCCLFALVGLRPIVTSATENHPLVAEVERLSLLKSDATKRVRRAEAHLRALDRLVEAKEKKLAQDGLDELRQWEMVDDEDDNWLYL